MPATETVFASIHLPLASKRRFCRDQLIFEFALDYFAQRDIGQAFTHAMLDQRAMPGGELANAPGHDIDQKRHTRDDFRRFFKEITGHMAIIHRGKKEPGMCM